MDTFLEQKSNNRRLGIADRNFIDPQLLEDNGFPNVKRTPMQLEPWEVGSSINATHATIKNHGIKFDYVSTDDVFDPDTLIGPHNPYSWVSDDELKDYVENCIEEDEEALMEYNRRNLGVKINAKSFDTLKRFITSLDLGKLQYCDSYDVNRVVKAIEVASRFKKSWMREVSTMILKDAIKMLMYVKENNFKLNGKIPKFFQEITITPFLFHFDKLNGTVTDVTLEDIKLLFFKIYVPFRLLAGQKFNKKNISYILEKYST